MKYEIKNTYAVMFLAVFIESYKEIVNLLKAIHKTMEEDKKINSEGLKLEQERLELEKNRPEAIALPIYNINES